MNNRKTIEALMYIQGEQGVTPKDLKSAKDISTVVARKELKTFKETFNKEEHGIMVMEFNDTFKFATRPEHNEEITKVLSVRKKQRLSAAAIETIGIIAYKQPITKGQVNEVRGVASEAVVNTLLVKGLIEEVGIAETPGRPILYGITNRFYDYFQINSLKELPKLSEFDESEGIDNDFELYSSQRGD